MLFFFQAEDGIRDRDVTGVQTCALPISRSKSSSKKTAPRPRRRRGRQENIRICLFELPWFGWTRRRARTQYRSEERRVGKECRYRWWAEHYKEKEEVVEQYRNGMR